MERNNLKIIIVQFLILLIVYFNIFTFKNFTATNINYLLFWTLTFAFCKLIIGINKDKYLFKIDVLQIIFIYCTVYLILLNILGIFTGFSVSPYNLNLFKILGNIIPALVIIIMQESVRYILITKSKKKLLLIPIIIVFILCDIMIKYNSYTITEVMEVFELIIMLIIPAIIKNLFITYLTSKNGYKASILFRSILELPVYFLPIFPNLGVYMEAVLYIMFSVVLFLKLNTFFSFRKSIKKNRHKESLMLKLMPGIFLIIMIVLISGSFKFYALSIASNSMAPEIKRGDLIVVQKLEKQDLENLEIGNILVYEHDNRIIVHRIIEIINLNNKFIYRTKGDNNENIDGYEIEEQKVRGLVILKIKYIGYLSVRLSEIIT